MAISRNHAKQIAATVLKSYGRDETFELPVAPKDLEIMLWAFQELGCQVEPSVTGTFLKITTASHPFLM
jgi:hypothetical protein